MRTSCAIATMPAQHGEGNKGSACGSCVTSGVTAAPQNTPYGEKCLCSAASSHHDVVAIMERRAVGL